LARKRSGSGKDGSLVGGDPWRAERETARQV